MNQIKNICINTNNLTENQVRDVNSWFTLLKNSNNHVNEGVFEDYPEKYTWWTLDRDGDRGYFPTEEDCMDDEFSCGVVEISYEELANLVQEELGTIGTTVEVKDSVNKLRQIDKPDYYQLLPEYQVSDINKALLDKIEQSDFDMTLNEAGWFQQAMQYLMRFYGKNGIDDLEKGVYALNTVIQSLKERENV